MGRVGDEQNSVSVLRFAPVGETFPACWGGSQRLPVLADWGSYGTCRSLQRLQLFIDPTAACRAYRHWQSYWFVSV